VKPAAAREIPLSRPFLDEREEELVLEVLRSGRLSLGPAIDRFEDLFAERVGAPYAAAVSSGTAGLHLLCHAAGIGPGDEVITSPYTFVASANCFIFEGAKPVFADVDPATLNLDPAAVEAAITDRTKAVVAVDIFGYPCELDELRAICDRRGLTLLDDACQAIGAEYRGRPAGAQGASAVFAFYPNKQIATGEGGVVTTHSEEECRLLRSLRNQGRSYEGGGWFEHPRLGFNYRWTDLQAAIGIAQLEKLDRILELRRTAAERYTELLRDVEGVEAPLPDDADHVRSWFVYVPKLAPELDRDRVLTELRAAGVQTAEYVPCVHLQPYMRERYGFREGMFPVAEDAARRTFALPFFTAIEPDDQERVVEVLRAAVGEAARAT
jgi:perosamine synthetase